jgi:hypothetical protein
MIFSPARERKTPCTQRVHKFYGGEGGRKISRKDTDFVYEYRFLVMRHTARLFDTILRHAAARLAPKILRCPAHD